MILKDLVDEDFVNYKKPSMFLIFPVCNFKCCIEAGKDICQNSKIAMMPEVEIEPKIIVDRYIKNEITKAVVCGGLEPMDSFKELVEFIEEFRKQTDDDVVIYTGYNESEIVAKINILKMFNNIFVKFGRFIPDSNKKFDETLGVTLASDNQYCLRIS